mmetsp:Transcript_29640/g.74544  ORF Transcript_29640/g.74544 Transcript_29640/m.74544 type:complete len:421 (+) Transcript_29640:91-1353(+)
MSESLLFPGADRDDGDSYGSNFVSKIWKMLENADHRPYIRWGAANDSIVITDTSSFAEKVIPHYFKHNNFTSFVRQLNLYGFHKTNSDSDKCEFQHLYFVKRDPELRKLIKRKTMDKNIPQQQLLLQQQQHAMHQQSLQLQQQQEQQLHPRMAGGEVNILLEMQTALSDINLKMAYLQSKWACAERENQALTQEITLLKRSCLSHEEKINNLTHALTNVTRSLLIPKRTSEGAASAQAGHAVGEAKGGHADAAAADVMSGTAWVQSKRQKAKDDVCASPEHGAQPYPDQQSWMELVTNMSNSLVNYERPGQEATYVNLNSMSTDALGSTKSCTFSVGHPFNLGPPSLGHSVNAANIGLLGSVGNGATSGAVLGSVGNGATPGAVLQNWSMPQLDSQTVTQSLLNSLVKQNSHVLGSGGTG